MSKCPICKNQAIPEFRPFCSKRCADVDLHRWFGGVYRVESEELPNLETLSENDLKEFE